MKDEPPPRLPGVGALAALAAAAAAHAPPRRPRSNLGLHAVAEAAAAISAADRIHNTNLRRSHPSGLTAQDVLPPVPSHHHHAATLASFSEWAPPSQAPLPPMHALPGMSYEVRPSHRLPWPQPSYAHHVEEYQLLPQISATMDTLQSHRAPAPLEWQTQQSFACPRVVTQHSAPHRGEARFQHSSNLSRHPASVKLPPVRVQTEVMRRGAEREEADARQRLSSSSQLSQEPVASAQSAELDVTAHERMESPCHGPKLEPEVDKEDRRLRGEYSPLLSTLVSRPDHESALSAVANVAAAAAPLPSNASTIVGLQSAPLDALADVAIHAQAASRLSASRVKTVDVSDEAMDECLLAPLRFPMPSELNSGRTSLRSGKVATVPDSVRAHQETSADMVRERDENLTSSNGAPNTTASQAVYQSTKPSDERKNERSAAVAASEGEDITRCPCGSTEFSDYMVACDDCKTWQHFRCMGLRRRGDVAPNKVYYCHLCRPEDMRPNCIAHPRYKEKALSRDRDRSKDLDPALSGVKPLELRRLFSADLKAHRLKPEAVDQDDLFRRYGGLFRNQFGKDKQSVIEGLTVVTEFTRLDVQTRLENVLRQMRGESGRNAPGEGSMSAGASAELASTSAASPVSHPSAPAASRALVSPRAGNDENDPKAPALGAETHCPQNDGPVSAGDQGEEQASHRGKRPSAKVGSKRPRSASVLNIGAGDDRPSPAGGDAAVPGDLEDLGANCRNMSREERKLFQIMRMFKKLEEQERGKKKPRTASAHDSPKQGVREPSETQALPYNSNDDRKVLCDVDASAARSPLSPVAVDIGNDVQRREIAGADPRVSSQPNESEKEPRRDTMAHLRTPGEDEDAFVPEAFDTNVIATTGDASLRDKKSASELDQVSGDAKKSAPAPESSPKVRLAVTSSRDRKGRRVNDSAVTAAAIPSALASARRPSGKPPGESSATQPVQELAPLDPDLLVRVHVPGPSLLRSQLVPVSRRSRLDIEAAEQDEKDERTRLVPRRLKNEWLHSASVDAAEKEVVPALPAKKQWGRHVNAVAVEPILAAELGADKIVAAAEGDASDTVVRENVRVSMVVVSEREALPDLGKKLEVSLIQDGPVARRLPKVSDAGISVVVEGCAERSPYDDAIRRVIVKSRGGAKGHCLKKRATMFFGKESSQATLALRSPRSPLAAAPCKDVDGRRVSSPSVSPILNLRSAPLPPRSPETPASAVPRKLSSSPRPGFAPGSSNFVSLEDGADSPIARMSSPLLKKRCTAFMTWKANENTVAGSQASPGDILEPSAKLASPASSPKAKVKSSAAPRPPPPLIPKKLPESSSNRRTMPKSESSPDSKPPGDRIPRVSPLRSAPVVSVSKCDDAAPLAESKSVFDTLPANMNSVPSVPRFRALSVPSPAAIPKSVPAGNRLLSSTPSSTPPSTGSPNWRPAYSFGNGNGPSFQGDARFGGRGKHSNGCMRNSFPPTKASGFGIKRNAGASPSPGSEGGAAGSKLIASGGSSPTGSAAAAISAWSSFRQQNGWSQGGGGAADGPSASTSGTGGASSNTANVQRRQRG
jgi:PHD-finger